MKKITLCLMIACLSLAFLPLQSHAAIQEMPGAPATTNESPEVNALLLRLHEIKDMDISAMTSSEKKALRKEVRSIRHTVRSDKKGNGVYLSVGAIIIIVVLLILLL